MPTFDGIAPRYNSRVMAMAPESAGRHRLVLADGTEHLVQAVIHVDQLFGYERWYLFDDVWAATHPALASSLLRCAASWDPFEP